MRLKGLKAVIYVHYLARLVYSKEVAMVEWGLEVPLSEASEDKMYRVLRILGGKNLQYRLSSLGINKGAVIKVIYHRKEPIVISVGDSLVALGYGLARRILVREIDKTS